MCTLRPASESALPSLKPQLHDVAFHLRDVGSPESPAIAYPIAVRDLGIVLKAKCDAEDCACDDFDVVRARLRDRDAKDGAVLESTDEPECACMNSQSQLVCVALAPGSGTGSQAANRMPDRIRR